jgi:hypothetical protein
MRSYGEATRSSPRVCAAMRRGAVGGGNGRGWFRTSDPSRVKREEGGPDDGDQSAGFLMTCRVGAARVEPQSGKPQFAAIIGDSGTGARRLPPGRCRLSRERGRRFKTWSSPNNPSVHLDPGSVGLCEGHLGRVAGYVGDHGAGLAAADRVDRGALGLGGGGADHVASRAPPAEVPRLGTPRFSGHETVPLSVAVRRSAWRRVTGTGALGGTQDGQAEL